MQPQAATFKDLVKFHSKDYITCLQKTEDCSHEDVEENREEFGIGVYILALLSSTESIHQNFSFSIMPVTY